MKFSTRTTYGLRSVAFLAKNYSPGKFFSLTDVSRKEKISQGYLEALFAKLKKAGIVVAKKGAKGGYGLSRRPREISVFEVVKTLEGSLKPFYCVDKNVKIKCRGGCPAFRVLKEIGTAVEERLGSMNLEDLVRAS